MTPCHATGLAHYGRLTLSVTGPVVSEFTAWQLKSLRRDYASWRRFFRKHLMHPASPSTELNWPELTGTGPNWPELTHPGPTISLFYIADIQTKAPKRPNLALLYTLTSFKISWGVSKSFRVDIWSNPINSPAHVLDFLVFLRFETKALQRRLVSRIEARFRIFDPCKNYGRDWQIVGVNCS